MSVLFCLIGWMDHYDGLEGDEIHGGGSWVDENNDGIEKYNFTKSEFKLENGEITDFCQGLVYLKGNIHIEKLGARKIDNYVDDVLVVWLATHPKEGGIRVVGWYKNACVFKECQEAYEETKLWDAGYAFNIEALAENCTLVPTEERLHRIPRAKVGNGGMGQSNIWYATGEKNKPIVDEVVRYIEKYEVDHEDEKAEENVIYL